MTTPATLLTLIAHAQQHVAALESLAAGMVAGLRAGMVDADHLSTLMTTQNARHPRTTGRGDYNDGEGGIADGQERLRRATSYIAPNVWHRRKKVILVITPAKPPISSVQSII